LPTAMNTRQQLLRRTLPLAVLAAGLALAGVKIYQAWPRQLSIEISYPSSLAAEEVFLDLLPAGFDGRPLMQVVFHPGQSARDRIHLYHSLKVSPGDYLMVCRLRLSGSQDVVRQRQIRVPESAVVSFELSP
jgi:hypothetical protein